jgi:hypothetical protein
MITVSKSMIALSALMSAGIVAAFDMSSIRADDQSATIQVTQRFPIPSEMFSPVSMSQFTAQKFAVQQAVADGRKGDKLQMSEDCNQGWPYLSQECLVSADGNPVRKVSRVITIERRIGDNISELVQVPVADLAQR